MPTAAHTLPPPLREGDRLTSDEFMRRWEAMPELKHAELLGGTVFMSSPVTDEHSDFQFPLSGWLAGYVAATPGCRGGVETTWLMTSRDIAQPDLTLRILPECGGQSRIEGKYPAGAPELVVEVAVSSSARDLGMKQRLYEEMGVREYVVAVTGKKQILWKELTGAGYRQLKPGRDGIIRSKCFPGLWLDSEALWRGDLTRVLEVVQAGVAQPEHAAFVAKLKRNATGG